MEPPRTQSRDYLRQSTNEMLADIARTEAHLERQLSRTEAPPLAPSTETEEVSLSDSPPLGSSPSSYTAPAAAFVTDLSTNFFEMPAEQTREFFRPAEGVPSGGAHAASAEMLMRAAKQQRRLAEMLPEDDARMEMIALAEQQESQAAKIIGQSGAAEPSALPMAPARVDMSTYTAAGAAGGAAEPTPPQTLPHVRAVLRRDSANRFKLQLKDSPSGVLISRLLPTDAPDDERSMLREGDLVRTINGIRATDMPIDELKDYVRDSPGALHMEVERFMSPGGGARVSDEILGDGDDVGGGGRELEEGLENVLGNVKSGWDELGRQFGQLMDRSDVVELRERAEQTSRDLGGQLKDLTERAGDGWKTLVDAGRDTFEDRGHALRQLGDGLRDGVLRQFAEPDGTDSQRATSGMPRAAVGPGSAHNGPPPVVENRRAEEEEEAIQLAIALSLSEREAVQISALPGDAPQQPVLIDLGGAPAALEPSAPLAPLEGAPLVDLSDTADTAAVPGLSDSEQLALALSLSMKEVESVALAPSAAPVPSAAATLPAGAGASARAAPLVDMDL